MTDASSSAGTASPNRSVMLVLAYLGPLALIPLLVEKNDAEVQWHAKHGLVLLVAEIVLWFGLTIVGFVLGQVPVMGCLVAIVGLLLSFGLSVGILVLHIVMILKALKGQRLMVPGVSEYANRF